MESIADARVDRHVYFLPHDGYRHVDAFDTRENVGHQIAPLVGFGISSIRDLIVRRAVDVMEDGPRQSPPCHRAEIRDVAASIDTHRLLHLGIVVRSALFVSSIPLTAMRRYQINCKIGFSLAF